MRKLGVKNATEITFLAMQAGLIEMPEWITQMIGTIM
jgi:hypothetical protein